jgi:hypothetical protein
MARLPVPGSDSGTWGSILNDFLSQTLNTDGTLKDGVVTEAKLDSSSQTKLNTSSDAVVKAGDNIANLADSSKQFIRVNIPDDGSPTGGWPDRYVNFFNGTRTGYFNEYGEVRARPGKTNTVPFRVMAHASGSSANLLEVTNSAQSTTYFSVSSTQANLTVPLVSTSTVSATNIGAKVIVLNLGDSIPPGTPSGTVVLRR